MRFFLICFSLIGFLSAAPKIEVVGSHKLNFGTHMTNEPKSGTFLVKNSGDALLVLKSVRGNCSCLTATTATKELKPGESAEIKVKLAAYGVKDEYNKSVFLYSNDLNKQVLNFQVSGKGQPLVEVWPRKKVYVGSISKTTTLERQFLIKGVTESELKLGAIELESTHKMKVTLEKEKEQFKLMVRYETPRTSGHLKSTIKVPIISPKGWKPITLISYGRVK